MSQLGKARAPLPILVRASDSPCCSSTKFVRTRAAATRQKPCLVTFNPINFGYLRCAAQVALTLRTVAKFPMMQNAPYSKANSLFAHAKVVHPSNSTSSPKLLCSFRICLFNMFLTHLPSDGASASRHS